MAKTISYYLQRSTDFFARYGGEEFVGFMLGDTLDQAFDYLKKVRQAVEDLHIPHASSVSKWVTVSVGGVTITPKVGNTYELFEGCGYHALRCEKCRPEQGCLG